MLKINYKLQETFNNDDTVTLSKVCAITDDIYTVRVDCKKYYQKLNRIKNIQEIWPLMSISDREFLISGLTPHEWNYLFGRVNEDDSET